MNIGIFDSGLGGLHLMSAIVKRLPQYNYTYLGDTQRVPYGNRSQEVIYKFTKEAVDFLFKEDCALIVIACNSASAEALRRVQQTWLPHNYPDRRVLGVVVPTVESIIQHNYKKVGVIATQGTISSGAFVKECAKHDARINVVQKATPLLVPLIEHGGEAWLLDVARNYLSDFVDEHLDALVLGCTHYPLVKQQLQQAIGNIPLISQDEIIPEKLAQYLERHIEIKQQLGTQAHRRLLVTDITPTYAQKGGEWFGESVIFEKVIL